MHSLGFARFCGVDASYLYIEYKNALGEEAFRYYDVSNGSLELSRENGYLIFEKNSVYEDNDIKTIVMEPIESIDELFTIYDCEITRR